MPKIIRSLIFILFVILCMNVLAAKANTALANGNSSEKLIAQYIQLINDENWSAIPSVWADDQSKTMEHFLSDQRNHANKQGLFNIKRAKLVAMKQIPYDYAERYLPGYIDSLQDPRVYYVAVDYGVYREDKYHINGVNYFLIVTVAQGGQRKIALTPHVPVNQLVEDGYGFGTADEKTYSERRNKFAAG